MTYEEKVQKFAEMLESQQLTELRRRYPGISVDNPGTILGDSTRLHYRVYVTHGPKYSRVDFDGSGKYMVEKTTGVIYGIKGYGVVHKGHAYGTLDTVDEWNWGGYHAGQKRS